MIEGHIYTEGRITKDYPAQIKAQIQALDPNCTKVIHHIQSPGGDCYAAFNGYHELMKIGKPIKSIIEGEAQSMATFLAIAPANEVQILDPSTFMIHEPFFPEGVAGTVDELNSAKEELEQIRNAMAEAYAKKTGQTKEVMLGLMKKTTRMDAKMALSQGFVDLVIEPSRIAGLADFVNEIKELKTDIMNLFKRRAVAEATALDLPLKDGKMITVQTENGDIVNKPATVDGLPAEGTFDLSDGRQITCAAGMVTAVKEAPMPEENAQQKLQTQLQALQSQIAGIKAAEDAKVKAAEDAAKIAAEQAAKDAQVKALEEANKAVADLAAKVKELESKPVGNQDKPSEGMNTSKSPFAIGSQQQKDYDMGIRASRSFIAEHFPHWKDQFYVNGKFRDGKKFSDYERGGPEAVSLLETNLNYTWNGTLDIKKLFYTPSLSSPALSDLFMIDTGSANNKRYTIIPSMDNVQKPYTGCDQAVTGTSVNITSKNIQLKNFQVYEKFCKDDFTDSLTGVYNVYAQEWLKSGNESFDPAGTPIHTIIMELLKDAIRRSIFRRASFGDTGSSSLNYNQIDGLITTLIDQSGASNYCVYRQGAALGVGTLAADTAATYFLGQYNNSNVLLKEHVIDSGKGAFFVTRSMWENYYTTLVGTGAVTEQAYNDYKKGVKTLEFRGIPVKPITIWDAFLAESTNPLTATTRHISLLTSTDNHILGVQDTADMTNIKSWFEEKDNARYYRNNMTYGVLGAINCDLTTISY